MQKKAKNLFLQEHVENTRAARVAVSAPSHAQWAVLIRQQNSLNRQLERKIRLLKEMQQERQAKEEGYADRQEAPFTEPAAPCPCPVTDAGQINSGCKQEKILNRGNEPKDLL